MPALIATYASAAGGAERLLLDVARGIEEPPLIACPAGWLADEARAEGFTVFELPERSLHLRRSRRETAAAIARLAAHSREIHNLCRDVRPDLLIAWGMRSAIAAAPAMSRLRDAPAWIFQHNDFLPGPQVARAVRAAAARATRTVCLSQAVAEDLDPAGALHDRIAMIHCGVDTERFRPGDAPGLSRAPTRDRQQQGGDGVLLLGAIVPWKRPDLALEIVARAAREVPDLRLSVVGKPLDGEGEALLARLKVRAAEPDLAGRVEFTGAVADPAAALRESAALLHCSDREPFGLAIAEALASGTPAVVPASGGAAEVVDPNCGATYTPGDAGAGAAALVDVLRRRDELSAPARRRAVDRFSLPVMHAAYADLFAGLPAASAAAERGVGDGITFVTVTYNSAPELQRLAASVERHAPGAELVVVDNASADESRSVAAAAGARLIAFDHNRGFGTAANAGVAAVTRPITVLVNPDVELVDGSLARLAARARPGRLHAPLLLDRDGGRQDSAQPRPASPATALYSLLPGAALPRPLRRIVEPWQAHTPRRVGWATGACLLAHTETLRALGPFDERIFMYAEDLDLGLRAETWFHPEARVIHTRAHSTSREYDGENFELLARQRRDVVRRRLGSGRAIVDDVLELVTFADRTLIRRAVGRSARTETARFRARLAAAVKRS